MAQVLGRGAGVFDLHNSDKHPGSYFTAEDIAEILGVETAALHVVKSKAVDELELFNESDVRKAWYSGAIVGAPPHRIRNFQRSLDELQVAKLISLVYPEAEIEHQARWAFSNNGRTSNRSLDLIVKTKLGTKIIEFHGPQHFARGNYGDPSEHPMIRKHQIEDQFGIECVIWPYWIQLCESNVRAIFEGNVRGYGLLWSTKTHFGDFVFDDSAELIIRLTERFNALRNNSVGYFYGPNTEGRTNVQHPIIASIAKGKTSVERLLPTGYSDKATWLPDSVR